MKRVGPALYRAVMAAAGPGVTGWLLWRRAHGKEDGSRFGERFGIAREPRPPGPLIWLHGASVGEAQSALALIDRLLAREPQLTVLVTTGTVTSARLMSERLPPRALHHYVPIDRAGAVRHFLDHWRPDLALWLESELWPNLVLETKRRAIPMLLVNARMSQRSFAGWRRWPGLIAPMLEAFALVLAQSEADAERLQALGAASVMVSGSLKYDAAPLPAAVAALERLNAALGDRPRWLAASTHPGEEEIAAAAHRALAQRLPRLLTIIVPRHPARGPAIAAELASRGLRIARRAANDAILPETEIYIADSMGELGLFYRAAPVAFVGGSLVPHGGQNLLEPACLACAILHGPHIENFQAIAAEMDRAHAAVLVRDAESLAAELRALLEDEALRARRGEAARRFAEAGRGVLERVMASLAPWIDGLGPDGLGLDGLAGGGVPSARKEAGVAHA